MMAAEAGIDSGPRSRVVGQFGWSFVLEMRREPGWSPAVPGKKHVLPLGPPRSSVALPPFAS
jgi:hypothetical protein